MRTLPTRSSVFALLVLGLALAPAACGSDQAANNDPGSLPTTGFGGVGGGVLATPSGGAGASSGGAGTGGDLGMLPAVCPAVPKGQLAELDDFEDGDSVAAPEVGREGYWFTVHDATMGSIVPDTLFVPVLGGANGTQHAAHIQASGYSEWGALFEVGLTYLSDGVHCPYNAATFAGVRFFTHGSGRIRVSLVTPATQDKEYGGACDPAAGMTCYDVHTTTYLTLSEGWALYELPWSVFEQRGFGTPAALDQGAIMGVQFDFDSAELPVDFWVDEVSFWDGKVTPPTTNGEGGADGEGGESGGAPSEAGAGGAAGHADP